MSRWKEILIGLLACWAVGMTWSCLVLEKVVKEQKEWIDRHPSGLDAMPVEKRDAELVIEPRTAESDADRRTAAP